MIGRLERWLGPRWGGAVILLVFLVCTGWVVKGWHDRSRWANGKARESPPLAEVSHPRFEQSEPLVRTHLKSLQERFATSLARQEVTDAGRARALAELGKAYLSYDFFEPAISCLRNAVRLDQDDYQLWHFLAVAHEHVGEIPQAIAASMQELERVEFDLRSTPDEVIAAWCLSADLLIRVDDLPTARRHLERLLELNSENLFARAKLAQIMEQQGDFDKAERLLNDALASAPAHAHLKYQLAGVLRQQGRRERAAELTRDLGKPAPISYRDPLTQRLGDLNQSSAFQDQLGQRFLSTGDFARATVYFRRAVERNQSAVAPRVHLGNALLNMGKPVEAAVELEEAIQLGPTSEDAVRLLCLAYSAVPQSQPKALERAQTWVDQHPDSTSALQILAEAQSRAHAYPAALKTYAAAAAKDSSLAWARLGEAVLTAANGDYSKAARLFDDSLRTFPAHAQLRHNQARLLIACPDDAVRNPERGLEIAQELFDVQPSVVRASTLALALAAAGRLDEARKRHLWARERDHGEGGAVLTERLRRESLVLEAGSPFRERWPLADEWDD